MSLIKMINTQFFWYWKSSNIYFNDKKNGLNISKDIEFPDHYKYMNTDIEQILNQAHALNSKIITTEKDYLRLEDNKPKEIKFIKYNIKNN